MAPSSSSNRQPLPHRGDVYVACVMTMDARQPDVLSLYAFKKDDGITAFLDYFARYDGVLPYRFRSAVLLNAFLKENLTDYTMDGSVCLLQSAEQSWQQNKQGIWTQTGTVSDDRWREKNETEPVIEKINPEDARIFKKREDLKNFFVYDYVIMSGTHGRYSLPKREKKTLFVLPNVSHRGIAPDLF